MTKEESRAKDIKRRDNIIRLRDEEKENEKWLTERDELLKELDSIVKQTSMLLASYDGLIRFAETDYFQGTLDVAGLMNHQKVNTVANLIVLAYLKKEVRQSINEKEV